MSSGTETLLKTLLKAAGFNPEEFKAGILGFIQKTQETLAAFEARQIAMENTLTTLCNLHDDLHTRMLELRDILEERAIQKELSADEKLTAFIPDDYSIVDRPHVNGRVAD